MSVESDKINYVSSRQTGRHSLLPIFFIPILLPFLLSAFSSFGGSILFNLSHTPNLADDFSNAIVELITENETIQTDYQIVEMRPGEWALLNISVPEDIKYTMSISAKEPDGEESQTSEEENITSINESIRLWEEDTGLYEEVSHENETEQAIENETEQVINVENVTMEVFREDYNVIHRGNDFVLLSSQDSSAEIEKDVFEMLERNETVRILVKGKEGFDLKSLNITEIITISPRNLHVLEIDKRSLGKIIRAGAERIYLDKPMSASLTESIPLIEADKVQNELGYTGEGIGICLLDTGVDYTAAQFSGKVVSGYDFVNGDGDAKDDNGHGTFMASIIHSIAPNATIIAVKVLDENGIGYSSDIIAGIEYCREQAATYSIKTLSMSFGGGRYYAYCNMDPVSEAVNDAYSDGLFPIASAGNDGADYITAPACAGSAIAVSSTTKSDTISTFSNMNGMVDLLAPGESVTADGLGGSETRSGTSVSTAHISGATALLFESNPSISLDEAEERFKMTGVLIEYNGANYSRINVYNAIMNITTGGPTNQTVNETNETIIINESDRYLVIVDSVGNKYAGTILLRQNSSEFTTLDSNVLIGRGFYDVKFSFKRNFERNETPGPMVFADEITLNNVLLDPNSTAILRMEALGSDATPFGPAAKKVFAIDPSNLNFSSGSMKVVARGKELYKCKDWDFDTKTCTGSWIKIMDIVPGEYYEIQIGPDDPAYAEYDSSLGAPVCRSFESPCIANSSLLMSRDSIGGTQEPNQPNTIDTCTDGSSGTYGSDESIENITITDLNRSYFVGGDTIQVNVSVHCFNNQDYINFVYTNSTSSIVWKIKLADNPVPVPCPGNGWYNISRNFTLDNIGGQHAVRVVLKYGSATNVTCGTGSFDDNDDVAFQVAVSTCSVISSPGEYALVQNVTTTGTCFTINASNVTFDCGGYSLSGDRDSYDYGFYVNSTSNVTIKNCNVFNFGHGVYLYRTNYSTVMDTTTYNNSDYGVYTELSNYNSLVGVLAYANSYYGFYVYSNNNNITNCTAHSNGRPGFLLYIANNSRITSSHSYNHTGAGNYDFAVEYDDDLGYPLVVNITNFIIDNPSGGMQNYSNISIYDLTDPWEYYYFKWTPGPSPLPSDRISFAQKYVNITYSGSSPTIESVTFHWSDSELTGYDESKFELWKYNASGWTMLNDTPDTSANTLSLTNMSPASTYGILQYNITGCQIINSSGSYQLSSNAIGAPYDASPLSGKACIKIAASDVIFDCAGYNITNEGTTGTTYGILLNGSLTNVTVRNCPGISSYTTGIYIYQSSSNSIFNSTIYNNSGYGIVLDRSSYTSINNSSAYRNQNGLVIGYPTSKSNIIENFVSYNNSESGFVLYNCTTNTIRNSTAHSNGGHGFTVESWSLNNNIIDSVARNNSRSGINILDSNSTFITNSTIYSNSEYGIILKNSSFNIINRSTVYGNNQTGIVIAFSKSRGNIVVNSSSVGNIVHGILVYQADIDNTITNFTTYNNGNDGINIDSTLDTVVTNSNSNSNSGTGFTIRDSNKTFVENMSVIGASTAFSITGSSGTESYYNKLNNCTGASANSGIVLSNARANSITNSSFTNNDAYGINLENSGATENLFINVILLHNSIAGIAATDATGNNFTNVQIIDSSNRFISSQGIALNNFTNLTFQDEDESTKVTWPSTIVIGNSSLNSNTRLQFNLASINDSSIPELNTSAQIALNVSFCDTNIIYKKGGFPTDPDDVIANGSVCTSPNCVIATCSGSMLYFNVTSFSGYSSKSTYCMLINSSGEYSLSADAAGAPYSASPFGGKACIKITVSNVLFDCKGHTITRADALGTTYGILLNGSLTNVTVRNCPTISDYSYGIYVYESNNSIFTNNTIYNSSYYGFTMDSSLNNTVSYTSAYNSSYYGFYITSSHSNNLTNNSACNNSESGFYLGSSSNNTIANSNACGNAYGFYADNSYNNALTNNRAYNNSENGFYLNYYCFGNTIANNLAYKNKNGFYIITSNGNNLINNSAYNNSQFGIYIYSSSNNNLTNNSAYSNSIAGILFNSSDHTILTNSAAYNNSAGLYVWNSTNLSASNIHVYNSGANGDVYIVGKTPKVSTIYFSNLTIDNPMGNFENYTSLTINDTVSSSFFEDVYRINWTTNPAALPTNRLSFRQKYVEITNLTSSVSIDSITWHWLDSEITEEYTENLLELWKYNASGWILLNKTPDTSANTLGLTNMNPASQYGILQYNSSCIVIDSSGSYALGKNGIGAPNSASPLSGSVCIKIAASDVLFDCAGYNITNDGTTGTTYGILLNGSLTNVTVRNCPSISNYTSGVYVYQSENSSIINVTSHNNTELGFLLLYSAHNNLINNFAYGNYYGFELASSPNSNLTNSTTFNNSQYGLYIYYSNNITMNNTTTYNNIRGIFIRYSNNSKLYDLQCYNNNEYGLYIRDSNNSFIKHVVLYNNSFADFYIFAAAGLYASVDLREAFILNPYGTYENLTTLAINDVLETATFDSGYTINWTTKPAALPAERFSFREKWVNIKNLTPSVSIDSITWYWSDSEITGNYDESKFELWKYNASGWTLMNDTPDTSANTLSLTNMNPASQYGILQYNSSCMVIDSSGNYALNKNAIGAPYDASPLPPGYACIKIASSNVVFDCNGYNITGDAKTGPFTTYGILLNTSITNVTIRNCPGISNYTYGLYMYDSNYTVATNCTAYNNLLYGFTTVSGDNNNFTNNTAYNNVYGFYVSNSNVVTLSSNIAFNNSQSGFSSSIGFNNTYVSNVAHDNAYDGFSLAACDNNTLLHNIAYNNSYYGFYLSSGSTYNLLINNTAYNNSDHGFYIVTNSDHNTLVNNTAYNNTDYGFYIASASSNNLTNNRAYLNTRGFYLQAASYNVLDNNNATNNMGYSFYVNGSSNYNNLTNNIAYNNSGAIRVEFSNYNSLVNNTGERCPVSGFFLYSANYTTLINNTARNNTYGVVLYNNTNNNTLIGNYAYNNSNYGFYVISSFGNNLTNNIAHHNSYGFYIEKSNYTKLVNVNSYSQSYGIILYDGSGYNLIENCSVGSNAQIGVGIYAGQYNNITNCSIYDNNYGIYLVSLTNHSIISNNLVVDNAVHQMSIVSGVNNTIFNNYFEGSVPLVVDDGTQNNWNTTEHYGPNIIGGQDIGGNYYGDYTGLDLNGDGIGDTADYNISGSAGAIDYLPLTNNRENLTITSCAYINIPDIKVILNRDLVGNKSDGACITINATNVTLDCAGHYITGNYPSSATMGVYVNSVPATTQDQATKIEHCNIRYYGYGVRASYSNYTEIRKSALYNLSSYGVYFYMSDYGELSSSDIFATDTRAVYIHYSKEVLILENTISNCSGDGIYLIGSNGTKISKNTLYNVSYGISDSTGSAYINISGNLIYRNRGVCIALNRHNSTATASQIYNNNCSYNSGYGVYTKESAGINFTNNTISHNGDHAFYINESSMITLENNRIYNNSGYPFFRMGSNNTLINNTIYNHTFMGVYIYGESGDKLINNTIYGIDGHGIFIDTTDNIDLVGNLVFNNDEEGIRVLISKNGTLANNTVYNCTDGFSVQQTINYTLDGNEAYNNSRGIAIFDTNHTNVKNCKAYNNSNDGFYAYDLSNTNITNCISYNNKIGFNMSQFFSGYNYYVRFFNFTAFNNSGYGLYLYHMKTFEIRRGSKIYNNSGSGIYILNADYGAVMDTEILDNELEGIVMEELSQVTLQNLTIQSNGQRGLLLNKSEHNTIRNNIISYNGFGFYQLEIQGGFYSKNNTIYNNIFNASIFGKFVYDNGSGNFWNVTQQTGPNIIGGRDIGGNYYSNYNGVDVNGDGIGDTEDYNISGPAGSIDYLPLTNKHAFTSCFYADVDNGVYNIERNLEGNKSDGACITVTGDNVTINCSGYNITGNISGSNVGIIIKADAGSPTIGTKVYDCNVRNYFYGYRITGGILSQLYNDTAYNNTIGFYVTPYEVPSDTLWNFFANITAMDNGYGVFIDSSPNNTIMRSNISANGEGIEINAGAHDIEGNVIMNNTIENNGHGIYVVGPAGFYPTDTEILYNNIQNNTWINILLQLAPDTIVYNNIINEGGTGIHVEDSPNANINFNSIENTSGAGIEVYDSNYTYVYNTVVKNSKSYGYLLNRSYYANFNNTKSIGNLQQGFLFWNYSGGFNNLTAENNTLAGIHSIKESPAAGHTTTFNNTFLRNNSIGFRVNDSWFGAYNTSIEQPNNDFILIEESTPLSTNIAFHNLTIRNFMTNSSVSWPSPLMLDDPSESMNTSSVILGINLVSINTSALSEVSRPATVTLGGVNCSIPGLHVFKNPDDFPQSVSQVLSFGWICVDPYCTDEHCVNDKYIFNTSEFSGYATASIYNITNCFYATIENETYLIASNLEGNKSDAACITVLAKNVTINCSGYSITGNYNGSLTGENTYGVLLNMSANDTTIRDCTVSNYSFGFYLNASDFGTIVNNTAYGNFNTTASEEGGVGFYVRGQGPDWALYNNLTNNTARNNSRHGFYLNNSIIWGTTLDRNIVYGNGMHAIYLANGVYYSNITNNMIYNNYADGIYLFGDCNNSIIANNSIYNSTAGHGITLSSYSGYNSISENYVYNVSTGYRVISSNDNNFTNNTARNCRAIGGHVDGFRNNFIDNKFYDSMYAGFVLYSDSSYNNFTSNIVNGSSSGFELVENNSFNKFVNNTIYNISTGFYADDAHNNTFTNNFIENSTQYGVYIQYSTSNNFTNNIVKNSTIRGFFINSSNNTILIGNNVTDVGTGFYVVYSKDTGLANNNVWNTSYSGFGIWASNFTTAINNNVWNADYDGYLLVLSNKANFTNNSIYGAAVDCFYLSTTTNSTFSSNNAYNCSQDGFLLTTDSDNNLLEYNTVFNGTMRNFFINNSDNNTLVRNNATYGGTGFYVNAGSAYTNLTANRAENTSDGFVIENSNYVKAYHNYVLGGDGYGYKLMSSSYYADFYNDTVIEKPSGGFLFDTYSGNFTKLYAENNSGIGISSISTLTGVLFNETYLVNHTVGFRAKDTTANLSNTHIKQSNNNFITIVDSLSLLKFESNTTIENIPTGSKVHYPNLVELDTPDDSVNETNTILTTNLVSINTTYTTELATSANVTLGGVDCSLPGLELFKAPDFPQTVSEVISYGMTCYPPLCSNKQCNAGSYTFDVPTFSGYSTSSTLNMTNCFYANLENTTYQLAGNLQGNKSDTACITINATNVTINCAGYSIRGTDPGPTKAIMAQTPSPNYYSKIENCTAYNYSYGFYSDQMFNSSIKNNTFYNNSQMGMYIRASNSNNFVNNTIYNNSGYGIYLYQSDFNIINDSKIYDNAIAGVYLYTWCYQNTLTNLVITNNGLGVGLQDVQDNNITSCNITNSSSDGIKAIISTPLHIFDNYIYNSSQNGIHIIEASGDVFITNNTIHRSGLSGIYINSSNITLINSNKVYDNEYGIYLDSSSNNSIINNSAYNNSYHGVLLWYSSDSNLTYNIVYNNSYYGFYIYSSSNNTFINNSAYSNSRDGFLLSSSSSNNTFNNNSAYNNSQSGFHLSLSSNNTFANNSAYNNSYNGFYLYTSCDYNILVKNSAYNNSQYGIYVYSSNATNITNTHLFKNGYGDFYIATDATPRTVYLSNVSFDNPAGNYENYTSLSITDIVEANTAYRINWTRNSSALPTGRFSFRQKFVNITAATGTVSIDSITWHWLDSEVTGDYNETKFELWKYNASGWTLMNDTPDTTANTLGLTNMNPASDYGILQNNVSGCQIISSPGNYQLSANALGAPYNASEVYDISWACIKIATSNVTFNCAGYNITNNGTADAAAIVINGSSAINYTNVTIRNCPGISGYEIGVYIHNSSRDVVWNVTAYNNSLNGFRIYHSFYNNLTNNTAYNNSQSGFYLSTSSNYNTLINNTAYYNGRGFDIDSSSNNTISNNSAYNNSNAGFHIQAGSYENNLTNNSAYRNLYGFKLEIASNNRLVDNIAFDNFNQTGFFGSGSGFFITTSSENNNFTHNSAYNNSYGGFVVDQTSSNIFRDNTAYNNSYYGFFLHSGSFNNLTSNTAYKNKYGIYLDPSYNNSIIENNVYNNSQDGLYLENSHNNTIRNNTAFNNSRAGFYFVNSTDNNLSINNLTNNTLMGLYLNSNSNSNTLIQNYICFNDRMDINNSNTNSNGVVDTCDYWYNWSENGHWGCTFACTSLWHRFFGNTSGTLYLTDNASGNTTYMFKWENATGLNVYITDVDAIIDWDKLQAIGRNSAGNPSSNDFIELDDAFHSGSYADNITITYSTDGSTPRQTKSYTVYGKTINYVPVANSSADPTVFQTGILWDTSDGGTEYSTAYNQSTVWIVEVNTSAGADKYWYYHYLAMIPYTLADYEGSTSAVAFYVEVQ